MKNAYKACLSMALVFLSLFCLAAAPPAPITFCDSLSSEVSAYVATSGALGSVSGLTYYLNGKMGVTHESSVWYSQITGCGITYPDFVPCAMLSTAMSSFNTAYPGRSAMCSPFIWSAYLEVQLGYSDGSNNSWQDWVVALNACSVAYPTPDTPHNLCDSLAGALAAYGIAYPNGRNPEGFAKTINRYLGGNRTGTFLILDDAAYWRVTASSCSLSVPQFASCPLVNARMGQFYSNNPSYTTHAPIFAWTSYLNLPALGNNGQEYSQEEWKLVLSWCGIAYPTPDTLAGFCDSVSAAVLLYNSLYPQGSSTGDFLGFMNHTLNNYGHMVGMTWVGNDVSYWYGQVAFCSTACPHVISCGLVDTLMSGFNADYPSYAMHSPHFIWTNYLNSHLNALHPGYYNLYSYEDLQSILTCCGVSYPAEDTLHSFCDSISAALVIYDAEYSPGSSLWNLTSILSANLGYSHDDALTGLKMPNTDMFWIQSMQSCSIPIPQIVNCTYVAHLMDEFKARNPGDSVHCFPFAWTSFLNEPRNGEDGGGRDASGNHWEYLPDQWMALLNGCGIPYPAVDTLPTRCDSITFALQHLDSYIPKDKVQKLDNLFTFQHYDAGSGQWINNTSAYWYAQISACGACSDVFNCDTLRAAVDSLGAQYPHYASHFPSIVLTAYLNTLFDGEGMSNEDWQPILSCCGTPLPLIDSVLTSCDTAFALRMQMEKFQRTLNAPLPLWVYEAIIQGNDLGWTAAHVVSVDSACGNSLIPIAAAPTTHCDSLQSVSGVYGLFYNILHGQEGEGAPSPEDIYAALYGTYPDETFIPSIMACDSASCIAVQIGHSHAQPFLDLYSCVPKRVFLTAMRLTTGIDITYGEWSTRYAACGDSLPDVCDSTYSSCDSVHEAFDMALKILALSNDTDTTGVSSYVFSAYYERSITSDEIHTMIAMCTTGLCDSFVASVHVANDTICGGDTAMLTSVSGSSYLWSTAETTASIHPTAAGTYSVMVSNSDGCTAMAVADVVNRVQPPAAPYPLIVSSGSAYTFTFSAVAAGTGGGHIEWATNSSFSPSSTLVSPADIQLTLNPGAHATIWVRSVDSATGCTSPPVLTEAILDSAAMASYHGKVWFKLRDNPRYRIDEYHQASSTGNDDIDALIKKYSVISVRHLFPNVEDDQLSRVYEMAFTQLDSIDSIVSGLQRVPIVQYAEKIPVMMPYVNSNPPNDAAWNGVTSPTSSASSPNCWQLHQVDAQGAWSVQYPGSSSVVIAIVDDGVQTGFTDLTNAVTGRDVANNDNTVYYPSLNHGSAVASVAGAVTDNGTGIRTDMAGMSYNCMIMPVKVALDGVNGALYNPTDGVQYAIDHGAQVVNMSFGGSGGVQTWQMLIDYGYSKGVTFVAAVGNTNTDIDANNITPATCNHVIAVGSTGTNANNDKVSTFSCFGASVDLMAPGYEIYVADPSANSGVGGFTIESGTSLAAPLVSGLAALMKSYNPNYGPDQIANCIISTADDIDAVSGQAHIGYIGSGRVNAAAAMACLQTPPAVDFTANTQAPCVNVATQFSDISTGAPGSSWLWTATGPSTVTISNPTAAATDMTFTQSGIYSIGLSVTNSLGTSSQTKTGFITVSDCSLDQCDQSNWYFGQYAGLQFQTGSVGAVNGAAVNSTINTVEGSISQSSASCGLLFYSDGNKIWDANHALVATLGHNSAWSTAQSGISIPDPANVDRYYLITLNVDGLNTFSNITSTLLDVTGGVVSVVGTPGQMLPIPLRSVSSIGEGISAVPACDGSGYYLVFTGSTYTSGDDPALLIYKIDNSGIHYSGYADLPYRLFGGYQTIKFSPDSKNVSIGGIIGSNGVSHVMLGIFDNSTGAVVGSFRDIPSPNSSFTGWSYGTSFSPNSNVLYVYWDYQLRQVYQYDLTATNISASALLLGSINASGDAQLQLGPDKRLYFSRPFATSVGLISYPDVVGTGCQFTLNGVSLATCSGCSQVKSQQGLPNMIDAKTAQIVQADFTFTAQNCTDVQFNSPICVGGHTWDFGDPSSGGSNTSTLQNPAHTFSHTGTYTIAHTLGSHTSYETITLGITASSITGPTEFCTGSSLTGSYNITASSSAGLAYHWSFDNTNGSPSATNSAPPLNFTWANVVAGGTVNVTVSDGFGCSVATSLSVSVNPVVTPSISVSSSCGSTVYMATLTGEGSSPALQWKINGVDQPGEIASSFSPSSVNTGDVISCELTSSDPCASPQTVTSSGFTVGSGLTVSLTPIPLCSFYGYGGHGLEVAPAAVNSTVTGATGALSYSWSGPTGSSGPYTNVIDDDITGLTVDGSYSVTVTDANLCTATASATVLNDLWAYYMFSPNMVGGGASSLCATDGTIGISFPHYTSYPPFSYSWSNTTATTAVVTGLSPGSYTLTITDAAGCVFPYTPTAVIPSPSTVVTLSPEPDCASSPNSGGAHVMQAADPTGHTYTYQWEDNAHNPVTTFSSTTGDLNSIAGGTSTTYSVTVTESPTGCTAVAGPVSIPYSTGCKTAEEKEDSAKAETSSLAADGMSMALVPNPAASSVEVSYVLSGSALQVRISIYDVLGQLVRSLPVEEMSGAKLVDVSYFASGTYQVVLERGGHRVITRRLVKN